MEVLDPKTGISKKIDVICKTAQKDKNAKFEQYLKEELQIIERLRLVDGVV